MAVKALLSSLLASISLAAVVLAQPSPEVQRKISEAIRDAAHNTTDIDYTQFVNVYIGTDNYGDVW